MHAVCLLIAGVCLVILLSLEQYSLFEIFRWQHIRIVSKASSVKSKIE